MSIRALLLTQGSLFFWASPGQRTYCLDLHFEMPSRELGDLRSFDFSIRPHCYFFLIVVTATAARDQALVNPTKGSSVMLTSPSEWKPKRNAEREPNSSPNSQTFHGCSRHKNCQARDRTIISRQFRPAHFRRSDGARCDARHATFCPMHRTEQVAKAMTEFSQPLS